MGLALASRRHAPSLPARLIKFSYILVTAQFGELYIKAFPFRSLYKRIVFKVLLYRRIRHSINDKVLS